MTNLNNISTLLPNNYDVLRFWKDGSLLLAASDLTGRLWNGTVCHFPEANGVPRQSSSTTAKVVEAGVSDGLALPFDVGGGATANHQAVMAYDSGAIEVLEVVADETGGSAPVFVTAAYSCEHDDVVSSISLACDGGRVVSGSYDCSIKIWSCESWTACSTYIGAHTGLVYSIACHPDMPDTFASCSNDLTVLLWDSRQPRPASLIHKSAVTATSVVQWLPTQPNKFVMGNEIGEVVLKDVRNVSQVLSHIRPLRRALFRFEFNPGSWKDLAVCGDETKIVVLRLENDVFGVSFEDDSHSDFVRGLAWHPKTLKLFSCGWDEKVIVHDNCFPST